MAYLYRMAHGAAVSTHAHNMATAVSWPPRSAVWLVLAFCSFAWVAIIFGCIELL